MFRSKYAFLIISTLLITLTACKEDAPAGGSDTPPAPQSGGPTGGTTEAPTQAPAVNHLPTVSDWSFSTDEDTAKSITLNAADADGDTLTFEFVATPSHGTITGTAPTFSYTPDANYHGSDSFSFKVRDGEGESKLATVSVMIDPVNDAPVATGGSLSTIQDTPVQKTLMGSDVDGDALTFEVTAQPSHGTVSGGSLITYTPTAGYVGLDSFSFRANDGQLNSPNAIVSITVGAAPAMNHAPQALATTVRLVGETEKRFSLPGLDVDGDPLTYEILTQPSVGNVTLIGGAAKFTKSANFSGASFTYRAFDGALYSPSATVTLTYSNAPAPAAAFAFSRVLTTADGKLRPFIQNTGAISGSVNAKVRCEKTVWSPSFATYPYGEHVQDITLAPGEVIEFPNLFNAEQVLTEGQRYNCYLFVNGSSVRTDTEQADFHAVTYPAVVKVQVDQNLRVVPTLRNIGHAAGTVTFTIECKINDSPSSVLLEQRTITTQFAIGEEKILSAFGEPLTHGNRYFCQTYGTYNSIERSRYLNGGIFKLESVTSSGGSNIVTTVQNMGSAPESMSASTYCNASGGSGTNSVKSFSITDLYPGQSVSYPDVLVGALDNSRSYTCKLGGTSRLIYDDVGSISLRFR